MRSVRLFRNEKVTRVVRPFWDSSQSRKFGVVPKSPEKNEPDPYEGNFSFTECDQYTKVTVVGAAGKVGRTLSLLLKTCPLVDHLCLFDIDKSVKGIGVDISHIDTKCCVSHVCGMRNIQQALESPDVVVIAAGCPTSPTLFGKKLFDKNAPVVAGLSEACARFCPKACIVLITSPINSLLPVMGEVYQIITNRIPSRKLFGLTTLDVVRANTFVAEVVRKDPNNIIVPVIGGTSQETIVPVLSQVKPCCKIKKGEMIALTECLKRAEENLADCQNCGTRGASSLSTAYAAFRFTSSLVMALKGAEDIIECAFVKSNIIPELEYLASPLKLGPRGVEYNFGYPHLSDSEKELKDEQAQEKSLNSSNSQLSVLKRGNFMSFQGYGDHDWLSSKIYRKMAMRGIHTENTSNTLHDVQGKLQKYRTYLVEDRKKTMMPTKPLKMLKTQNEIGIMHKVKTIEESSRKSPWDVKFGNARYKVLNAAAKQKIRSFNSQKKIPPSASVLLLLDREKKERDKNGKHLISALSGLKEKDKETAEKEKEEEGKDEEQEEKEEIEEQQINEGSEKKNELIISKSLSKDDEASKHRDYVLRQLRELRRENDELKKKLLEVVKDKKIETALQIQSDNLEMERTKLKACWLIMSSTIDAFSNFCRKFTSSKNDSKLLQPAKVVEEEEEQASEEDEYEDARDTFDEKYNKKGTGYDEKYYNFLEKLMEDQVECEKKRTRMRK